MRELQLAQRLQNVHKSGIRKIFESAPEDSINLGLGEIQFPTPAIITAAAAEIMKTEILKYTPNAGLAEARSAVADHYARDFLRKENVCLTNGVTEGIFISVLSLVNPGDEVLISDPAFVAYETIIRMAGGIPVFYDLDPLNDFEMDKDSFRKSFSSRTKMVILNNPSNPLGKALSSEEIDFILDLIRESNSYLLVDEIYKDLYLEKKPHTILDRYDKVIIASGLSKSHCMTGWRIGWLVNEDPGLIEAFTNTHQYINACAPYLSQKVIPVALSPEGLQAGNVIRERLIVNRNILSSFLLSSGKVKILQNDASPYLFVNFGEDDVEIATKLAEVGVIVIPGRIFGKNGKNWIRINYGVPEDQIKKVFTRIEPIVSHIS